MPLAKDLLCPPQEEEKRKPQQKHLVQSPNSYFMGVRCPGCYKITNDSSHTQTVVLRSGCSTVLWQPTGGKARLPGGCSFRQKQHWKYPASERMGKHPNKHILDIKKKKIKISRNTSADIQMFKLTPVCFRHMEVSTRRERRVEPSCPWKQESEKVGYRTAAFIIGLTNFFIQIL